MASFLGDDSDEEIKLSINKEYAERYKSWRQKEELQKLKDRYGEDVVDDDGDDSSSSDDIDVEDIQQLDKEFLKTLSYLKNKDPRIYDKNIKFFEEPDSGEVNSEHQKKIKDKPVYLRDFERKLIVERGGKYSDEEDENGDTGKKRPTSPTFVEQEKAIKESFHKVLKDSDEEDETAWGGLFQKREKSQQELDKENEEFEMWLKGEKKKLSDKNTEKELRPLHDFWNDPQLDEGERFLKDYLLNKRYIEDEDVNRIPTYDEIVHDSDEGLSQDEETIETQEHFERKFNFRFEEPDQDFVKRYPRTVENSTRRKDDRRKQQREMIRERKAAEMTRKKEEIKRLKALKKKEIEDKIKQLKEITGNTELGFKDEDIEGDFDPAEYDKRMKQLFSDNFYEGDDEEKPEFPDLDEELELENWDHWNETNYQGYTEEGQDDGPHCEDPDFNMDCDYDPKANFQQEMLKSVKGRRNKKRQRNKLAEALSTEKPVFDPNDRTFDEYFDEYYNLDFEDIIGDLPCRFKYRNVIPNNFGLSIDEILKSDDKELNRWCSLKKAVQYRPETVEKYDLKVYQKKAQNEFLKKKYLPSLYSEKSEDYNEETEQDMSKKKRKRKKKRKSSETYSVDQSIAETANKNKAISNMSAEPKRKRINEDNDNNVVSCLDGDNYVTDKNKNKKKKVKERNVFDDKEYHGDIKNVPVESVDINNFTQKKKKFKQENISGGAEKTSKIEKNFVQESLNTFSDVKEKSLGESENYQDSIGINSTMKNDKSQENILSLERTGKKRKKKKKSLDSQNNTLLNNCVADANDGGKQKSQKKIGKSTQLTAKQPGFQDDFGSRTKHNNLHFKNKKHKFQNKKPDSAAISISDTRLRAYGIRPKKFKNKLKYGKQESY